MRGFRSMRGKFASAIPLAVVTWLRMVPRAVSSTAVQSARTRRGPGPVSALGGADRAHAPISGRELPPLERARLEAASGGAPEEGAALRDPIGHAGLAQLMGSSPNLFVPDSTVPRLSLVVPSAWYSAGQRRGFGSVCLKPWPKLMDRPLGF